MKTKQTFILILESLKLYVVAYKAVINGIGQAGYKIAKAYYNRKASNIYKTVHEAFKSDDISVNKQIVNAKSAKSMDLALLKKMELNQLKRDMIRDLTKLV